MCATKLHKLAIAAALALLAAGAYAEGGEVGNGRPACGNDGGGVAAAEGTVDVGNGVALAGHEGRNGIAGVEGAEGSGARWA